jgi:hypothetical protein
MLTSAAGYKSHSPVLVYWRLGHDSPSFPAGHNIEAGLEEMPSELAIDEQSKLLFVAGKRRIKSFAWISSSEHVSGSVQGHSGLPAHMMNSSLFRGPLHIFNDCVFRAGKGSGVED